ncbi:MAG TPA: hypothetical protein VMJ90_10030 [Anaerolineales bacterium]|nr:hypothetical protein [Anaerolineales bacterium]
MKKQTTFLVFMTFLISLACQLFFPASTNRDGTIISSCTDVVKAFRGVQPGAVPQALLETGIKQGNEFDVGDYFDALTHVSMTDLRCRLVTLCISSKRALLALLFSACQ